MTNRLPHLYVLNCGNLFGLHHMVHYTTCDVHSSHKHVSWDVEHSDKARWSLCSILQFATLSVLTVPVIPAHSHAPVMRGLKETTAVRQVCQIQTYVHAYLYSTYISIIHNINYVQVYIDNMAHYTIFENTAHCCIA